LNLLRLGATRITGVEVNRGLIAAAESRLGDFFPGRFALRRIEYIDGEYRLPFVDGQFDIVWAHAVMEHVLPRQRRFVLGELWRVLKRGGIFVVDGTPNKLWIIEFHTSGLPFLNYLPLRIAAGLARRFSERIPPDQTNERLLERGFRGCTYWEILHSLPGAETVNLRNPRSDIRLWRAAWWKKKDTWKRNPWKRLYGGLLYLASPILSMLRIPPVALLPGLILVMRKPEGE
jgi:SAM-dependent methyltransferase